MRASAVPPPPPEAPAYGAGAGAVDVDARGHRDPGGRDAEAEPPADRPARHRLCAAADRAAARARRAARRAEGAIHDDRRARRQEREEIRQGRPPVLPVEAERPRARRRGVLRALPDVRGRGRRRVEAPARQRLPDGEPVGAAAARGREGRRRVLQARQVGAAADGRRLRALRRLRGRDQGRRQGRVQVREVGQPRGGQLLQVPRRRRAPPAQPPRRRAEGAPAGGGKRPAVHGPVGVVQPPPDLHVGSFFASAIPNQMRPNWAGSRETPEDQKIKEAAALLASKGFRWSRPTRTRSTR